MRRIERLCKEKVIEEGWGESVLLYQLDTNKVKKIILLKIKKHIKNIIDKKIRKEKDYLINLMRRIRYFRER